MGRSRRQRATGERCCPESAPCLGGRPDAQMPTCELAGGVPASAEPLPEEHSDGAPGDPRSRGSPPRAERPGRAARRAGRPRVGFVARLTKPDEQRANQGGGGVVATPGTSLLTENEQLAAINVDYEERYGFHDAEHYLYKAPKGLNREIVEKISEFKSEPEWMREFRLKALDHFFARAQPTWGSPMLAELDYDNIRYFVRASETPSRSWDDVPEDVKRTFDRLGIPEAERKFLSGVGAQYESEVV